MTTIPSEPVLKWSLTGYYVICCISVFNVILFLSILLTTKCRQELYSNKHALLILMLIVCGSLNKCFFMNGFIWNFNQICSGSNGNCLSCTIIGYVDHYTSILGIAAALFMILRVIEINFQPFPMLAYSDKFLLQLKLAILILLTIFIITKELAFPVKYAVYELQSNKGIDICIQAFDEETVSNFRTISLLFGPVLFGMFILFCLLFTGKAVKLYDYFENLIDPDKVHEGLEKLKCIMRPIINHSILVITIIISFLCSRPVLRSINPDGMPLDPINNFLIGMCIIMLHPFGKGCFSVFCGCFERFIISRWVGKALLSVSMMHNEKFSSNSMNEEKVSGNQKEINAEKIAFSVPNESLPTIQEQTDDLISMRTTISPKTTSTNCNSNSDKPDLIPEWREIELSMEAERLQQLQLQKKFTDIWV